MSAEGTEDVQLSRLLREWRPDANHSPGFEERVWRRVAQAEGARIAQRNPVNWLLGGVLELGRPSIAAAYLALLLLAGSGLGFWRGHERARAWNDELGRSYVLSVSPSLRDSP